MPDYFHPLRLAIDGNEANCARRVGSNAYAYHLLTAFDHITNHKRRGFHLTILLARPPLADLPPERPGLKYRLLKPQKLWTQLALPLHLFFHRHEFDAFFTPGHYAPRSSQVPYISSVMDLAFLTYPELFKTKDLYQLEAWTRYSVLGAQKVVAISRFTKNEICRFYHRQAKDVILAPPGLSDSCAPLPAPQQAQILNALGIRQAYFLYLGTIQPRKNIIRLLEAFELFCQKVGSRKTNYQLVLAGKNGWLTDQINQRINLSPLKSQILLTGFINEEQKNALLHHALATFNLGIYEGFGIPALESLACGTLPIFANNTSLPEVVGPAGLGVNPFNASRIANAMLQTINLTRPQKKAFLALANTQVKKFSYEKSANQILSALYRLRDDS